jgi:hypothetical protein
MLMFHRKGNSVFDTKIVIILRDDLKPWQGLNVTAFLASGIVGAEPAIIGEAYRDRAGNLYNPMSIQPMVVLSADATTMAKAQHKCLELDVRASAYIEEMFATGHDTANRAVFAEFAPDDAKLVGLAFRAPKKVADKISKGARMHA